MTLTGRSIHGVFLDLVTPKVNMIRRNFLLFLLILLHTGSIDAAPASDEKMAGEARPKYLSKDIDGTGSALQKHTAELQMLAAERPNEVQVATVYFKTGLSYKELSDLRQNLEFEVIDVSLKAPMGDKGVIMSLGGGMADLFLIEGTFEQRLTYMVEHFQKCDFLKGAEIRAALADESAKEYFELATRPFGVYSARIFGAAKSLNELRLQPTVFGILLSDLGLIADFEDTRQNRKTGQLIHAQRGC